MILITKTSDQTRQMCVCVCAKYAIHACVSVRDSPSTAHRRRSLVALVPLDWLDVLPLYKKYIYIYGCLVRENHHPPSVLRRLLRVFCIEELPPILSRLDGLRVRQSHSPSRTRTPSILGSPPPPPPMTVTSTSEVPGVTRTAEQQADYLTTPGRAESARLPRQHRRPRQPCPPRNTPTRTWTWRAT